MRPTGWGWVSLAWIVALGMAAILLAGCPRDGGPRIGTVEVGGSIQLQAAPGATWVADCGTVDALGKYSAPVCGTPMPQTCKVTATAATGQTSVFTVMVREYVKGIEVVCGQPAGDTNCHVPPVTVEAGKTVQFYARTDWTCHAEWSPGAPPPVVP